MKWSEIYLKTLKEKPVGASIPSHILLLRAGFVSMSSQGIYTYNTLFLRSIQKISTIIREELEKQSAREILMPMVQTKELWDQSERWNKFEGQLLKMKGRTGTELCLGPTHEELIIDFVKSGLNSWRDMPLNLYQIQTKYRDEIRPRFGLLRCREFLMKDAYSFDTNNTNALKTYQKMFVAYQNIFDLLGVKYVIVKADSGAIGGNHSEEFHILANKGEDELMVSEELSANREICPRSQANNQEQLKVASIMDSPPQANNQTQQNQLKEIEELVTPNIKSIQELAQFLNCEGKDLVKILFFISQDQEDTALNESITSTNSIQNQLSQQDLKRKAFAVLCLGDDEVNPIKVKQTLNFKLEPLLADESSIYKITGAKPGSCGPYHLKINIPIYLDNFLKDKQNFITGANKDGLHLKNINPYRDFEVKAYGDFCFAREGDLSPQGSPFKKYRGIEVGHLFYLSTEYSKKMNLSFLDKQGKKQFVEMGCYGLGVTRTLQALIEQKHDDQGMIWPLSVAPFAVHICLIDPDNQDVLKAQTQLIQILDKHYLDYFIDDRRERPGVKFKDADLIGLPLRINLGARDLKQQQVEVCLRKTGEKQKLSLKDLENKLNSLIKQL